MLIGLNQSCLMILVNIKVSFLLVDSFMILYWWLMKHLILCLLILKVERVRWLQSCTCKACDWMEWSLTKAILRKIDFDSKWITSVMMCLQSVSFFVLMNEVPSQKFFCSRGLRQRDSLFSHVFIFYVEVLSNQY